MRIRRLLLLLLSAVILQLLALSGAYAQEAPQFKLGFATLAAMIPDIVGQPVENEYHGANGDGLQHTTTGLMVWRKADNWTAFTNGYMTWVNGPNGLQERLNTERFPWEAPPEAVLGAPPPAPPAAASGSNAATVAAWSPLLDGQKLRDALAMAYAAAPDWRQFADVAVQRRTPVRWGDLPSGVGGVTRTGFSSGALRVQITLNSIFQDQSTAVVAAVLAHETYHAATGETALSGEACLQNEIDAYRWQAYVWRLLPKPATSTFAVADQNHVVALVDSGQIDSYIRNSPSYQRECRVR